MEFPRTRHLASLAVLALVAVGCGGAASSTDAGAGPGMSDLAPSYDARPDTPPKEPKRRQGRETGDGSGDRPDGSPQAALPSSSKGGQPAARQERGGGRTRDGAARSADASVAGPVSIQDPSGDLSASPEGAPPSADIVAVALTRKGDEIEVRTTFAGPVPVKQSGSKGMNVASFYDVDGNGMVDYEVWASLADNGWGTGHLDDRRNKATFGPSTGIEVTVEGKTLVTRFPLERVGGARGFRWSAASEWGSYESMAASTSARDYAPDDGAAEYPG